MNKILYWAVSLSLFTPFFSCSDNNLDLKVPYVDDVTLNELEPGRFSHVIPDGGFTSGGIHFNTVKNGAGDLEAGFAYSTRSNRSYTWTNTKVALDSNIFSVYTGNRPNRTETYAVCKVSGDNAFLTLDKATVVEHILVGNTTYNYFALKNGDSLGTTEKPEVNPNIPSAPKGIWYSYVPGGVKKMALGDKDYFTLVIKGFEGNTDKGEVKFFLCTRGADVANPTWDYVIDDWYKVDLTSLGTVDKLVFNLQSSDIEAGTGRMRTPSYFCLDGIRLQK